MIEWNSFAEQIRRTGEYRTPEDLQLGLADRLLGRFDWRYHYLIYTKVRDCANIAIKGTLDDPAWARQCLEVIQVVERCGGRVAVDLPDAARGGAPCVFVGNHMSVLETLTLPAILLSFCHPAIVVKQDLLEYPVFKHIIRSINAITVTRDNPRQDMKTVFVRGAEALARGHSVLIFPQSTRHPVFDPTTFNSMGVKLAARAGVPVVPLALKTDLSGLGRWVKEFGKIHREKTVHFRFGEPLNPLDDPKKTHQQVVAFIQSSLQKWNTD